MTRKNNVLSEELGFQRPEFFLLDFMMGCGRKELDHHVVGKSVQNRRGILAVEGDANVLEYVN